MLMKTPKNPKPVSDGSIDDLMMALRIPERPAAVRSARAAADAAKADRITAQSRHHEAFTLLRSQRLGQALAITHQQVDDIGAAIAPAIEAESSAQQEYSRLVVEFSQNVCRQIEDPLCRYRDAVAEKMAELEDLLAIGVHLHSDSVGAGIKLPSKLPSLSAALVAHVHAMRRVFSLAK